MSAKEVLIFSKLRNNQIFHSYLLVTLLSDAIVFISSIPGVINLFLPALRFHQYA